MATSEVEPQEDLPSRSEWNGLESTEHMDFNNTTSTTDITTASTIMTTSNSSRITALNPTTADSDSATIRAGAITTTTAAIITSTSSTPSTTDSDSDCEFATIRAGATAATITNNTSTHSTTDSDSDSDSDCEFATIRAGATAATITNTSSTPSATDSDSDSDCDSAPIAGAAAAIITNNTPTPTTTDSASTTAATTTDFTTNSTTATTISTSDLTSTEPTTTTTTCDLTTSDLTTSTSSSTTTISSSDLIATTNTTTSTTTTTTILTADDDQTDEEQPDEFYIENATSAASDRTAGSEDHVVTSTPTHLRPAPPITLALSGSRPRKKKILLAPALSLSLGQSQDSALSEDFPSAFLSPSPEQEDDTTLDMILDGMETPSDSESLHFPSYDLDLEDEFRRLGVSSHQQRSGSSPRPGRRSRGFGSESASSGLGCLDREDTVDSEGTRWRTFSTGQPEAGPPQEGRVNMSVVEPYLRVLSHGGYYGDGMNDIIVFSSCYLPENSLNNYHYVMDNLFRYVVGTLDLMVAENYVIVYLCAGAQKERLPGISWLRECYTTIHRRLRKNLKGLYVVHPTWFIKAMITIIKPFISSKFSRKLQFVDSLQELSQLIPTEHVQIPDSVRQFDENLNR